MQRNLEKTLSVIMAVYPALGVYYALQGTTLASFLLWLCIIPVLVIKNKNVQLGKDEVRFFLCILFVSVMSALIHLSLGVEWFDFVLFSHNLYTVVLYLVPLCFIAYLIDVDIFVKAVLFGGGAASLIVIWQSLSLTLTGTFYNDFFIPGLEIKRELDSFSRFRPSAFFTEPAHFAMYMLPAFQIALLKKNRVLTYLFAISILFSGSSTGFVLLPFIIFSHLYETGAKKWYVAAFGMILVAVSVYTVYLLFPDVFLNHFDKLDSVRDGASSNRLLGPLIYLKHFHFYEHICGITLNQLDNLVTMLESFRGRNYANSVIYMYISFGVMGLILFVGYVVNKVKSTNGTYGFLLIFIGIACSDQILFNAHYVYLACFVLMSNKINNVEFSSWNR